MKQKCIKCGNEFELREFKVNPSTRTPYRQCKGCHAKIQHEAYLRRKGEREYMNKLMGIEVFRDERIR